MQVYIIAFNEDSTGHDMKFHTGLRLKEDGHLIVTNEKEPDTCMFHVGVRV
jgi:hypothetical protein